MAVYCSCYTHVWVHTAQKKKKKKKKRNVCETATIHVRPDTIHTCSKVEGTAIPFPEKIQKTQHTQTQRWKMLISSGWKHILPRHMLCSVLLGPAFYRWPSPSKQNTTISRYSYFVKPMCGCTKHTRIMMKWLCPNVPFPITMPALSWQRSVFFSHLEISTSSLKSNKATTKLFLYVLCDLRHSWRG